HIELFFLFFLFSISIHVAIIVILTSIFIEFKLIKQLINLTRSSWVLSHKTISCRFSKLHLVIAHTRTLSLLSKISLNNKVIFQILNITTKLRSFTANWTSAPKRYTVQLMFIDTPASSSTIMILFRQPNDYL